MTYKPIEKWTSADFAQSMRDAVKDKWRLPDPQTDTPKLWRDMAPEEKAAFWLRVYQGGIVEWRDYEMDWERDDDFQPDYFDDKFYRIRPEPKRETVTLYGGGKRTGATIWMTGRRDCGAETHRITFDLIDGQPDPASIRMEKLETDT